MVLGRFSGTAKGEDVATLIAKKNYSKAIEVIREQLATQRNDPRLRLQLADVLVSAGKASQAVTILLPLADEFAKDGFAAKAISVLKKIQRIEPGRRDIDGRLANLIEEKQRLATVIAPAPSGGALEIGIEEIGFAPSPGAGPPETPPSRAVAPEPAPPPRPAPAPVPAPSPPRPEPPRASTPPPRAPAPTAAEPELELEAAPELDLSGSASPAPGRAPAIAGAEAPTEFDLGLEAAPVVEEAPADLGLEAVDALPMLEPEAVAPATPPAAAPVVDQDLFTGEFESVEPLIEVEPTVEPEPAVADPMTDSRFADELFSVLESAFQETPGAPSASASPDGPPSSGAQIVVSPLFKDFSVEELVAVIGGLKLLTFERGKVILREGEPGHSLYMLTSGTVKAFVKRDGKQVPIAELEEGAFFGEVSILTGKPRTATVVAKEHCELLELDRPTLDAITQTHPHVLDVLQEFANQRMARKG
jgi:hypothetical protein